MVATLKRAIDCLLCYVQLSLGMAHPLYCDDKTNDFSPLNT